MAPARSIAFLGASAGCGLSALRHALAAGVNCTALCRNPQKLEAHFPPEAHRNLTILKGNAHNVEETAAVLVDPTDPTRMVDAVSFSIGGAYDYSKFKVIDADLRNRGITTLLAALNVLRGRGVQGKPRLMIVSTNGIANKRDYPFVLGWMYLWMLKVPHEDKKIMEQKLYEAGRAPDGEEWVVVRPSLLTEGPPTDKNVRVGVSDPIAGTWENMQIGYSISREDVGRWIWEQVFRDGKYLRKAVSITY